MKKDFMGGRGVVGFGGGWRASPRPPASPFWGREEDVGGRARGAGLRVGRLPELRLSKQDSNPEIRTTIDSLTGTQPVVLERAVKEADGAEMPRCLLRPRDA